MRSQRKKNDNSESDENGDDDKVKNKGHMKHVFEPGESEYPIKNKEIPIENIAIVENTNIEIKENIKEFKVEDEEPDIESLDSLKLYDYMSQLRKRKFVENIRNLDLKDKICELNSKISFISQQLKRIQPKDSIKNKLQLILKIVNYYAANLKVKINNAVKEQKS